MLRICCRFRDLRPHHLSRSPILNTITSDIFSFRANTTSTTHGTSSSKSITTLEDKPLSSKEFDSFVKLQRSLKAQRSHTHQDLLRVFTSSKLASHPSTTFQILPSTYSLLIHDSEPVCRQLKSLSHASLWYNHAREHNVELEKHAYSSMINIAGKVGRYDKAEDYFQDLVSAGFTPSMITWNCFLESMGRDQTSKATTHERFDRLQRTIAQILDLELKGDLKLNAATFSIAIDALSRLTEHDESLNAAINIFLNIPQSNLQRLPQYNHWSSIIEGCCRHHDLEKAFQFIRWMKYGDAPFSRSKKIERRSQMRRNNHQLPLTKNPYLLCLTLLPKDRNRNSPQKRYKYETIKSQVLQLYHQLEGQEEGETRLWRQIVALAERIDIS